MAQSVREAAAGVALAEPAAKAGTVGASVLSVVARVAEMKKVRERAEDAAEERILDILVPKPRADSLALAFPNEDQPEGAADSSDSVHSRQTARRHLPRLAPL